jgi:small ligand-binding sensory domain FIST
MKFGAAVSLAEEGRTAARELLAAAQVETPVDLAALFFTGDLRPVAQELAASVRTALQPRVLIGCSCEGVIGADREVERAPAASLLAGRMPGVQLQPFHVELEEWRGLLESDERLQQRIGTGAEHRAQIVLGDPFTTPADALLQALDRIFPGCPTMGGMASAAWQRDQNVLLLDDALFTSGAVGVGFGGAVRVDAVVSQGCRPVGSPMVITRAHDNVIEELGRRNALEAAQEMLRSLPPADLALLQESGYFLGIVINEYQETFGRGDFLIRNLLSVDRETGCLIVGDLVRPGQTIQFHARDAAAADEDLRLLLHPHRHAATPPAGGLLFSCNGRGLRMFEQPNHDVAAVLDAVPATPLAGFFAAGELGPVGNRSFSHGHTASIALFRPAPPGG